MDEERVPGKQPAKIRIHPLASTRFLGMNGSHLLCAAPVIGLPGFAFPVDEG